MDGVEKLRSMKNAIIGDVAKEKRDFEWATGVKREVVEMVGGQTNAQDIKDVVGDLKALQRRLKSSMKVLDKVIPELSKPQKNWKSFATTADKLSVIGDDTFADAEELKELSKELDQYVKDFDALAKGTVKEELVSEEFFSNAMDIVKVVTLGRQILKHSEKMKKDIKKYTGDDSLDALDAFADAIKYHMKVSMRMIDDSKIGSGLKKIYKDSYIKSMKDELKSQIKDTGWKLEDVWKVKE